MPGKPVKTRFWRVCGAYPGGQEQGTVGQAKKLAGRRKGLKERARYGKFPL